MSSDFPICRTCGVQYDHDHDLNHCPICEDERQYVPEAGQLWTSNDELREQGHRAVLRQEAHGLWGIGTEPRFAIGQRALLVPGDGGNLLWDCVTYLDDAAIAAVNDLGGISAIAISHPHYYSAMVEWSEAFGGVPIYIHARDADWVQRRGQRPILGRGLHRGAAWPHPVPGWHPLRRRHHRALGGRRRGPRRAVHRRHLPGRRGPPMAQLHVQLPEPDPGTPGHHPAGRQDGGTRWRSTSSTARGGARSSPRTPRGPSYGQPIATYGISGCDERDHGETGRPATAVRPARRASASSP